MGDTSTIPAGDVVFVGGPNVVFRGQSDWGDRTPTDVGFTPQTVVNPATYIDLSPGSRPYLDLRTYPRRSLPAITPIPPAASQITIDLNKTQILDTSDPANTKIAYLSSILQGITKDSDNPDNTNGKLTISRSALVADSDKPGGPTAHRCPEVRHHLSVHPQRCFDLGQDRRGPPVRLPVRRHGPEVRGGNRVLARLSCMAATSVLTLAAWNDLLTRINNLADSPPAGCKALDALPLATAPHRWSTADITAARSKLSAICSTNVFSAPSTGVWMKSVIDELNTAIGKGWCKCQQACCVPNRSGTVQINPGGYSVTIPFSEIVTQYLYGYVSYSDMVAAMGSDVVANLAACIVAAEPRARSSATPSGTCTGPTASIRTAGSTAASGRSAIKTSIGIRAATPTRRSLARAGCRPLTPGYASSTATGSSNYYDQPLGMGTNYDYQAGRYYQTFWIGAFDMDAYVYDLSVTTVCP